MPRLETVSQIKEPINKHKLRIENACINLLNLRRKLIVKNLKINAKLMVGFGVMIVLLLAIAFTSITYLVRSSNNINYLASQEYHRLN